MEFKGRLDITLYAKVIKKVKGGACEKFLFEMDGEKYVFKQNFCRNKLTEPYFVLYYEDDVNQLHSDIVEVFAYKFLKELGCDFALPYYLASFHGKDGCFCPYFGKNSRKFDFLSILQNLEKKPKSPRTRFNLDFDVEFEYEFMMASDGQYMFSVPQVLEKTEEFCKTFGFDFDKQKTQKKLEQMVVFDYFMGNNDRTWRNIVFMQTNKDGKQSLELAPLFDNGESFGMEDFQRGEFEKQHNQWLILGMSENGRMHDFEDNNYFKEQRLIACDICNLAKKDTKIHEIVEKYKKLNFKKFLSEFEKENKLTLLENFKTEMERTFLSQREVFTIANKKLEKRLAKAKNQVKTQTKCSNLQKQENLQR